MLLRGDIQGFRFVMVEGKCLKWHSQPVSVVPARFRRAYMESSRPLPAGLAIISGALYRPREYCAKSGGSPLGRAVCPLLFPPARLHIPATTQQDACFQSKKKKQRDDNEQAGDESRR